MTSGLDRCRSRRSSPCGTRSGKPAGARGAPRGRGGIERCWRARRMCRARRLRCGRESAASRARCAGCRRRSVPPAGRSGSRSGRRACRRTPEPDAGFDMRSGPSGPRLGVRVGRPGSGASGRRTVEGGIASCGVTGRWVRLEAVTGGAGTRSNSATGAANAGGANGDGGIPFTLGGRIGASPRVGNERDVKWSSDASRVISLVSSAGLSAYPPAARSPQRGCESTDDCSRSVRRSRTTFRPSSVRRRPRRDARAAALRRPSGHALTARSVR